MVHDNIGNELDLSAIKKLVVIDEADKLLFGDGRDAPPSMKGTQSFMLALSATGLTTGIGTEKDFLHGKLSMFRVETRWASAKDLPGTVLKVASFEEFLLKTADWGKVVYVRPSELAQYETDARAAGLNVITDCCLCS